MLNRFKNSNKNKKNSGGSGAVPAEAQQNVTAAAAAAKNHDADGLGEFAMGNFEGSNLGIYDSGESFDGGGGDDMMNFGDFDSYNMDGLGGVGGDEYGTNAYDDGAYGVEDINFNSYDGGMGVGIYDSSLSVSSPGLETGFDSSGDPTGTAYGNDGDDLQVHHGQSGTTVNVKDGKVNGSTMIRRLSGPSIQSQSKTGSTSASTKATGGSSHGMPSHPVQKKNVRIGGKPLDHTNTNARSFTKGQMGHPSNKTPANPSTIDHDSSFRRVVPVPPTIHKTPRTVPDGGGRNSKDGSSSKSVVFATGTKTPKTTASLGVNKFRDNCGGRQLSVTPSPYPRGGERPGGDSFMVDSEVAYQTPNGRFNSPYVADGGRMRGYIDGEDRNDEEQVERGEEDEYDDDHPEEMDVEQSHEQLLGILQQLNDIHSENVDEISHLEDIVEHEIAKLLHMWKKLNDIHDKYEEMDTEMDHLINILDSFELKRGIGLDGPDH